MINLFSRKVPIKIIDDLFDSLFTLQRKFCERPMAWMHLKGYFMQLKQVSYIYRGNLNTMSMNWGWISIRL